MLGLILLVSRNTFDGEIVFYREGSLFRSRDSLQRLDLFRKFCFGSDSESEALERLTSSMLEPLVMEY